MNENVGSLRIAQRAVVHDAIDWSEDDKIVVATESGMTIVSLNTKIDTIASSSSVFGGVQCIGCPETVNEHDVGVSHTGLESKLGTESKQCISMQLDRTMCPRIQGQTSYKVYKQTKWSPANTRSDRSCILASLTRDHRLTLWKKEKKRVNIAEYISLGDLSTKFYEAQKGDRFPLACVKKSDAESKSLQKLKLRTYSLAAVSISWSSKLVPPEIELALLAVCLKSGHVVLWEVPLVQTTLKKCRILDVVDTRRMNPLRIDWCALHDNSGLVSVGYSDGTVKAFPVLYDSSEKTVTLGDTTDLWAEQDNIAVTHFCWDKQTRTLVAAKGLHLLMFIVSMQNGELHCTDMSSHLTKNTLNFTGLLHLNNSILASSEDGILQKIACSAKGLGESSIVSVSPDAKRWLVHGMKLSPQRHQVVILQQVLYHLMTQNNVQMMDAFEVKILSLESNAEKVASKLLAAQKLNEFTDVIRHFASVPTNRLPKTLLSISRDKDINQMSLQELKLTWLFVQSMLKHSSVVIPERKPTQEKQLLHIRLGNVANLILRPYARTMLQEYLLAERSGRSSAMMSTVATMVKASVQMFSSFLIKANYFNSVSLNELVSTARKHLPFVYEKCPVCRAPISFQNVHLGVCDKGHTFPRCSKTLLIIKEAGHKTCPVCGVYTLCRSDSVITCTFCDGYIV